MQPDVVLPRHGRCQQDKTYMIRTISSSICQEVLSCGEHTMNCSTFSNWCILKMPSVSLHVHQTQGLLKLHNHLLACCTCNMFSMPLVADKRDPDVHAVRLSTPAMGADLLSEAG